MLCNTEGLADQSLLNLVCVRAQPCTGLRLLFCGEVWTLWSRGMEGRVAHWDGTSVRDVIRRTPKIQGADALPARHCENLNISAAPKGALKLAREGSRLVGKSSEHRVFTNLASPPQISTFRRSNGTIRPHLISTKLEDEIEPFGANGTHWQGQGFSGNTRLGICDDPT